MAQAYRVSQHTRASASKHVCGYCHDKDAGVTYYGEKFKCSTCNRIACKPCLDAVWVYNAGCCILCVRKLGGVTENDASQDAVLKAQIPCAHIEQVTYGGLTMWRCLNCTGGGLFTCPHTDLSPPNFMGTRTCTACKRNV